MVLRQTLREIIDSLPEDALQEAGRRLNSLAPFPLPLGFLEAREDDEPITPEDDQAIEDARSERAQGAHPPRRR
jgi:hypothetical protein